MGIGLLICRSIAEADGDRMEDSQSTGPGDAISFKLTRIP
jgi:hypothetical protein